HEVTAEFVSWMSVDGPAAAHLKASRWALDATASGPGKIDLYHWAALNFIALITYILRCSPPILEALAFLAVILRSIARSCCIRLLPLHRPSATEWGGRSFEPLSFRLQPSARTDNPSGCRAVRRRRAPG